MTVANAETGGAMTRLFNQPKGLYLLFTAEMWERFSYYGMRGLLVLFLTAATENSGFGWSNGDAIRLYGIYTALVYFTPAFGGLLADRWLGYRRAVFWGGASMALGHFLMAGPALFPYFITLQTGIPIEEIMVSSGAVLGHLSLTPEISNALNATLAASLGEAPSESAQNALAQGYLLSAWSFYAAIGFIIIGNGLFKPNMSTIVGQLYEPGDNRRDSGYTIFYMGINIGAFLANLVAGTVGELWGWHYGFTIAGFGMVAGLLTMVTLQERLLGDVGKYPNAHHVDPAISEKKLDAQEINRIKAIFVFGLFSVIFWMGFEQMGGLLNLYTYEKVDRNLLGFEVPATWFQSLNPMFIFLFAPVISAIWMAFDARGAHVSTPRKFAIGLALMGAGFVCMIGSAIELANTGTTSMLWLVGAYFLQTMGELCISPVGLSMVNLLAPARFTAMAMGFWFLNVSLAGWLAGEVGALSETLSELNIFIGLAAVSMAAAVVLLMMNSRMIKWMNTEA